MFGSLLRVDTPDDVEQRLSVNDYARLWEKFAFNGNQYVVPGANLEELTALEGAGNPIVWACVSVRLMVFADTTFGWVDRDRRFNAFSPTLAPLKAPFPGGTEQDVLARMEVDASLYGNSYWVRQGGELQRLDPRHVKVVTGSRSSAGRGWGETLAGYMVVGEHDNDEIQFFLPDEVAHYRPTPDPKHPFRGVSWLNPVLPDVMADDEMTRYKGSFLRNAATPNMVVSFDPTVDEDSFQRVREVLQSSHTGSHNAFKTLYLGGGADVKLVGSNLQEVAAKAVQGAGETRIAAAAGVPAVIVGLSEAMQGSALTTGNYGAARRRFADGTVRYLWRRATAALETIVPPPRRHRMWIDETNVAFLQEDVLDAAEITVKQASTIESYIRAGFEPASAVEAVTSNDMRRLVHTGLVSVQLQPPGTDIDNPNPTNPFDQGATDDDN